MNYQLDYFYGKEADQFTFFRIPKLLFTDSRFSKVSIEAKVLYGLLLDRMSLSVKNGWVDEENRVYIYFKVSDAMECMDICKEKCIKLFAELDSEKGCGLIFRKRQGLGKPSIIYVMNFNSGTYEEGQNDEGDLENFQRSVKQTSGGLESTDFKRSVKQTSGRSELPTSESSEDRLQEVSDADSNENKINNNKNNNNNYFSDTYHIKSYPGNVAYPIELSAYAQESSAMGFITSKAAEAIEYDYEYSGLHNFIALILDDMCRENDDCEYEFKGIKIWLSR